MCPSLEVHTLVQSSLVLVFARAHARHPQEEAEERKEAWQEKEGR